VAQKSKPDYYCNKISIKILQGNIVTQTVLDGQTIHPPVDNFLQRKKAKNYKSWLAVDKVIAIFRLTFFQISLHKREVKERDQANVHLSLYLSAKGRLVFNE